MYNINNLLDFWKPVEGCPSYEVSYNLFVRNKISGKILKHTPPTKCMKYYKVAMKYQDNGMNKYRNFSVHRVVASAFCTNYNGGDQVNHKNGDKLDNRVENLEWVTNSQNRIHAFKSGLQSSGEDHWISKLTNEQVKFIKNKYSNRSKRERPYLKEIALEYGVCFQAISNILRGKVWRFHSSEDKSIDNNTF